MKQSVTLPVLTEIMTRDVVTAREGDTLLDAQRLMVRNKIARLIITDDRNKPIGILTRRDVIRALLLSTKSPVDQIPIGLAMTKNPIYLDTSANMQDACGLMISRKFSSIVVVDDLGRLVGVVTKTDICRYLSFFSETNNVVSDCMSKKPVTIGPNHSVFTAANILALMGFTRLVVVDDENRPIGIVTLTDLVSIGAAIMSPRRVWSRPTLIKEALIPSALLPILLVRNIMTYEPYIISEVEDVADAAKLMMKHSISGLPVVDSEGKLSGIITKTDLVKVVSGIR